MRDAVEVPGRSRPNEHHGEARVLLAFDKFRGSATARELARAGASTAREAGIEADEAPMSDGGEGFLDALLLPGDSWQRSEVTGALGRPVEASWLLRSGPATRGEITGGETTGEETTAFLEAAEVIGLERLGGAAENDAVGATTRGIGELVAAALSAGATTIVLGVGGSATTDGGAGALAALAEHGLARPGLAEHGFAEHRLARPGQADHGLAATGGTGARLLATGGTGARLVVACDVSVRFLDAARIFAPQKGALPGQVGFLTDRLERLVARYQVSFGVDVAAIPGSGAAGGLAGGLAAIGAELVPGARLVAGEISLDSRVARSDLVVTGEGRLDATSFAGKVVGTVINMAGAKGVPAVIVAGQVGEDALCNWERSPGMPAARVISLAEIYGMDRSLREPLRCVEQVLRDELSRLDSSYQRGTRH